MERARLWMILLMLSAMLCSCGAQPTKAGRSSGLQGETPHSDAGSDRQTSHETAGVFSHEEVYAAMSANAYSRHLRSVFVSLLPECMDAADYSLGVFSHYYGAVDTPSEELDQVETKGGGIYWITESQLPAFYGLLKETEQLLASAGQLRQEGETVLLSADEVEACAQMLLRSEVSVLHRSTAGAEWDETQRCYRYTKLIDPLQAYTEKGWELIFLGDEQQEDPGAETLAVCPFWQNTANGDLYTFTGELLCTKCQRIYLTGEMYTNYYLLLKLWQYGDNIIPLCAISFSYDTDENGERLPYDSSDAATIRLGTGSMMIPDLSTYAEAPIDKDIVLNGEGT